MILPTVSRCLVAALLAAGGVAVFGPARAQLGASPNPLLHSPRPNDQPAPAPAPAPAIPGSRAAPDAVAPADRSQLDMHPTEALFDAINRGDLAAARDAVSRGADLDGRNLLGLTPLELSVDLGRNEISFLLLSMRGTASAEHARQAGGAAAAPAPARSDRGRPRVTARQLETAPAAVPRSITASGGTPVPSAGFLGFDLGRGGER